MTSRQEKKRLDLLEERRKDHEKHAAERLASVNRICSLAVANGMTYGKYITERDRIMSEENKVTVEEAPKKHGGIREPLPPEKVERVKEMLAEGAKISDIVAETLVSRATIDRIKNGTYGLKQPKKVPAAVAAETSGQRTDGILHELISRAVETLRDTQGDTPDDCALVGKALGLLTAAEMILGDNAKI